MKANSSISESAESYRRGVVFGLTMAEVLLLLIFCILLFLKIISVRLSTAEDNLVEVRKDLLVVKDLNSSLSTENQALLETIALLQARPEGSTNERVISEFVQTVLEKSVKLQVNNPDKAEEFLYALQRNPSLLNEIKISTVDEWDELTTIAQNTVNEYEAAVLSELAPKQREMFFQNADVFSQLSSGEIRELSREAQQETDIEEGNNWPPIISLTEAQNYSFQVGSAKLGEGFRRAISSEIAAQITTILDQYDADVIEVIGHTDPQRMRSTRVTNLDEISLSGLKARRGIPLNANDNAGLGYARALSVVRELMKVPALQDYTILPYSAAQMINPSDELASDDDKYDPTQLRRIEIRVRRRQ